MSRSFVSSIVLAAVTALAVITSSAHARQSDAVSMRDVVTRFKADRAALRRKYAAPMSTTNRERMRRFLRDELNRLETMDFDALSRDDRVDWILLRNLLRRELDGVMRDDRRDAEVAALLPFAPRIVTLLEAKERFERPTARDVAQGLHETSAAIRTHTKTLSSKETKAATSTVVALRAARRTDELRRALKRWFDFSNGYDPIFSWWNATPHKAIDEALRNHAAALRRHLVEADGDDTLVGDPIGDDALRQALAFEMIPYTPEELIAIAHREFAWCDREMARATKELGHDNWRAAQSEVKSRHVAPGEQPKLIHDLAVEAIRFLEDRDLVTVPPLCKETWRMSMLSPARQKISPYFLGGEVIQVAYPTDAMSHPDKLMSLRGNNVHFARATVQHELIPGHHLQGFMTARHRPWRGLFRTPFWVEGWALYWEMLLWDLDFPKSPEDRIGMLFWRKHRCARIIFSLSFHMEKMTAREAVDFLVERVGHERNNAEAEVRRSVGGAYGPLYQAAYMLGGLQIRALHREFVGTERMTNRDFHNAILRQNAIPIELLRTALTAEDLPRDMKSSWRFYGEIK